MKSPRDMDLKELVKEGHLSEQAATVLIGPHMSTYNCSAYRAMQDRDLMTTSTMVLVELCEYVRSSVVSRPSASIDEHVANVMRLGRGKFNPDQVRTCVQEELERPTQVS